MPVKTIMASLLRGTRKVLLANTAINIEAVERFDGDVAGLNLHDVTAIGGFCEPLGVRTAFSFETALLDSLFGRFTADIPIPKGQELVFVRDTAAELTNLILGVSSGDFPHLGQTIGLIPVVVLAEERHINRRDHTLLGTMRVRASSGRMDIHLLWPKELFDIRLNERASCPNTFPARV